MLSLKAQGALALLVTLSLSSCGGGRQDAIDACWEHVRADANNLQAVPGLEDAELKRLDDNAEKDGDQWIAVGKADVNGATVEFGCVLDADLTVTDSQFGPEGSIDTN